MAHVVKFDHQQRMFSPNASSFRRRRAVRAIFANDNRLSQALFVIVSRYL
jgi:hypothetical protein